MNTLWIVCCQANSSAARNGSDQWCRKEPEKTRWPPGWCDVNKHLFKTWQAFKMSLISSLSRTEDKPCKPWVRIKSFYKRIIFTIQWVWYFCLVTDSLQELLVNLLPPERKLVEFRKRPLVALNDTLMTGDRDTLDRTLLLWSVLLVAAISPSSSKNRKKYSS